MVEDGLDTFDGFRAIDPFVVVKSAVLAHHLPGDVNHISVVIRCGHSYLAHKIYQTQYLYEQNQCHDSLRHEDLSRLFLGSMFLRLCFVDVRMTWYV